MSNDQQQTEKPSARTPSQHHEVIVGFKSGRSATFHFASLSAALDFEDTAKQMAAVKSATTLPGVLHTSSATAIEALQMLAEIVA